MKAKNPRMTWRMILQNLMHRPVRTSISIVAVALEVGMVMLVVGLTHGLLHASAKRIGGVGGNVMVEPPGASIFMGLSTATLPISLDARLARFEHVQAVTPVLLHFTTFGTRLIWGIDMKSWNQVTGGFFYFAGGPLNDPYDILVDNDYARQNHVQLRQVLRLFDHNFRVCGIVEHGKGSRLFIPLETVARLADQQERASIFFIKCTNPAYTSGVVSAIKKAFPNDSVLAVQQYMSMLTSDSLPPLADFITVMISIAATIGFLVIFLSTYTTVTERTREIGILKSLGASRGYILRLILREVGALSIMGILLGYGAAWLGQVTILDTFPTISIELTFHWAAWAALVALGGSLLGAFYPALRSARLDPVDALAYE